MLQDTEEGFSEEIAFNLRGTGAQWAETQGKRAFW